LELLKETTGTANKGAALQESYPELETILLNTAVTSSSSAGGAFYAEAPRSCYFVISVSSGYKEHVAEREYKSTNILVEGLQFGTFCNIFKLKMKRRVFLEKPPVAQLLVNSH
jgi:hypothetical protein